MIQFLFFEWMITKAIKRALLNKERKGWSRSYWAFDIHETILQPTWKQDEISKEFYPHARETLRLISKREDVIMILYSCSNPKELEQYLQFFRREDIYFSYINENPDVPNADYGNYDKKPYFNVLFEDKAGFDAWEDWKKVQVMLTKGETFFK